jgi:hypothetical protein
MTIIDGMFRPRSRFCAICDSKYRWQCTCPNNKVMAEQVNRSFQSGKRYRGKRALEYCNTIEEESKKMKTFKEMTAGQEAYRKFFDGKLAKWNIKSPAELDDKDKKKFYNEIEKEWDKDKDEERK